MKCVGVASSNSAELKVFVAAPNLAVHESSARMMPLYWPLSRGYKSTIYTQYYEKTNGFISLLGCTPLAPKGQRAAGHNGVFSLPSSCHRCCCCCSICFGSSGSLEMCALFAETHSKSLAICCGENALWSLAITSSNLAFLA